MSRRIPVTAFDEIVYYNKLKQRAASVKKKAALLV